MGELTRQMCAGGPGLLGLSPVQNEFYQEQAAMDPSIRYDLHKYRGEVMRRTAHYLEHELKPNTNVTMFLAEYVKFMNLTDSWGRAPLSEKEFRTLLVWAGHGPAIVHGGWVRVFREAVLSKIKQDEGWVNEKIRKQPHYTFVLRLIEAANTK